MAPIEKVRKWLRARGFRIVPGVLYAVWSDRTISYRPQDSTQAILRGLLHECGHVLIDSSLSRGRHKHLRYKEGYAYPKRTTQRTNASAADLLSEEIEAWHRGYALAKRLRIRIDSRAYWVDYGACIKGYMRLLLRRKV